MRAQRKCEIMTIEKVNPFNQLSAISGYNVIPTASTKRQESEPNGTTSNGTTTGVNTNIKPGQKMFFAAQAGKQAGEGTTLAFA